MIYNKNNLKKGFTIIELISVMGVIAVLVFLGTLAYNGYTKQAKFTKLQFDARVLSDACERYYVDTGDYPRLMDSPYSSDQVNNFAQKVYDNKGAVISLNSSGNYYDIDLSKLKKYATVNESYLNFVLQNPVGDVYMLDPITNIRLPENAALKLAAPTISVDTQSNPPAFNITYPKGITPQLTEYQLDGGDIFTSAPSTVISEGSHNIKVRYKSDNRYSDWASQDFIVLNHVKQLSVGYDHCLALMQDGTVKAWGYNYYGQLGNTLNNGTSNPNPTPTTIQGLSNVKEVYSGSVCSFALMNDGSIKAWGSNRFGQLGVSTNNNTNNPNPTPITISSLYGASSIVVGNSYNYAIMSDSSVKSFGCNYNGNLGYATNLQTNNPNPNPTTIPVLTGVKQMESYNDVTMALMNDGTVKSWGFNNWGQLGTSLNIGTSTPVYNPTTINGLSNVKHVYVGGYSSMALLNDGTVKAWGLNQFGCLGISTNAGTGNANYSPINVPALSGASKIALGQYHGIALMNDGTVKTWGVNRYGQLAKAANIGTSNYDYNPTTVSTLSGITDIKTNNSQSFGILSNGSIMAWGYNNCGQLGVSTNSGTENANYVPMTIPDLSF